MYDRILMPIDGSPTAGAVAPYASWLALQLGTPVEVVTVVPSLSRILRELALDLDADDIGGTSDAYPNAARLEEVRADLRARAATVAEEQAQSLREKRVSATVRVAEGEPGEAILAASRDTPNSLITMSTNGRSGIQRWFVGSVTTKVIREAECPVLVIRPNEETTGSASSDGIVVPLDGSNRAEKALAPAQELASRLGLPVHLVRSVSLSGLGYGFVEDGPTLYADLAGSVDLTSRDYISSVANELWKQGLPDVSSAVADKSPDEAIIDAVGTEGNKLVIMTSHGRTGLNRALLGSVTDRVIRNNTGPVLVIPSFDTHQ